MICCCCGKAVAPERGYAVRMVGGGAGIVEKGTPEAELKDDMGYFIVGSDCVKGLPKEYVWGKFLACYESGI